MKPADSMDFAAMMWLSVMTHAWVAGLAWHFWLSYLDLGPWFWIPLAITSVPTTVFGAACFGQLGEMIGLWSKPR